LKEVTAIPRNNADFDGAPFQHGNPNGLGGNVHIQAIANVAGFHFGHIEQGGSSLYATMSQKVSDPEVLAITLGIGGDEIAHFLEWVDFSGNGVQAPVAPFTDPTSGLTFPNFFSPLNPKIQPSLIFPVPCEFISPKLPHVSIIRPLTDRFAGAVATVESFTADGLFFGQSQQFLSTLQAMAVEADAAAGHEWRFEGQPRRRRERDCRRPRIPSQLLQPGSYGRGTGGRSRRKDAFAAGL